MIRLPMETSNLCGQAAHNVLLLQRRLNRPIVVLIAGGTGSGKTEAIGAEIKRILDDFRSVATDSTDNYYRGAAWIAEQAIQNKILNWDMPEVVELNLLRDNMRRFQAGDGYTRPVYNMVASERVDTTYVEPADILLVDGIFALDEVLAKQGDYGIYVDADFHARLLRRMLRDTTGRTGMTLDEVIRYFIQTAEPAHRLYVESSRDRANIIIANPLNPTTEVTQAGEVTRQVKFPCNGSFGFLSSGGVIPSFYGEPVGQTDYYLRLPEGGEVLRLRQESEAWTFTYKAAPQPNAGCLERPTLTIPIGQVEALQLISFKPLGVTIVNKKRRSGYVLYSLPDGRQGYILVAHDTDVTRMFDGQVTELGNWVEASLDKGMEWPAAHQIIAQVCRGLDNTPSVASYLAMPDKP